MKTHDFLTAASIDVEVVTAWIEAGWLAPRCNSGEFLEVDVARARLIRDLEQMGVNNEGIPVILDLVDQLHGLRRALQDVLSTVRVSSRGEGTGTSARP